MITPDSAFLRQMVYGGAVLGGGGGGSLDAGLKAIVQALSAGKPRIATLREFPKDARLVTFSRIGAVSGQQAVDNLDQEEARALRVFCKSYRRSIDAIIASEVGPLAVTYGLKVSAQIGLPLADAPCNGRAHPLALMGSLGLHRLPEHHTWTVAVGGMRRPEKYVELMLRSNAAHADRIVRNTVAGVGTALACVRNPLPVSHVARHAAVGALSMAQRLGQVFLDALPGGADSVASALARSMHGKTVAQGVVRSLALREKHGYTLGHVEIIPQRGDSIMVPVCNEYMMVIRRGRAVAAFPDLIVLLDRQTALPLATGELRPGSKVLVFVAPKAVLRLGSALDDRSLLRPIEKLLNLRFAEVPRRNAGGMAFPADEAPQVYS